MFKKSGFFLLIYSFLVFSGGCAGFVMKKSLPSLLAGGIFGLLFLWASTLSFAARKQGIYLGFVLLILLEGFFSYRFITSRQLFPSGLMVLLTSLWIFFLILNYIYSSKKKNVS